MQLLHLYTWHRSCAEAKQNSLEQIINNLFKPTGYVMHHQFNIQQFYILSTLYVRVLYLSQNKQQLLPRTT
jgi:hypothetical protein